MYQKGNKEFAILSLYLKGYDKRFYLREICKLSKLSLKTTQRVLSSLEKEKILKSEVSGKNKYFMLNLDNIKTKSYLEQAEIYNLMMFIEKYPVFKTFLKEIKDNALIIVFGSFAKFKADKESDVDFVVIGKIKLPFHILPYKIHEINLSEGEFLKGFESEETLIKKIVENHVILNNPSFFINIMWNKYGRKR